MKKSDIYKEAMYEVYDPWTARTLAYFYNESDAKLFRKAYDKRRRKIEA